jgi:hypothetical protein
MAKYSNVTKLTQRANKQRRAHKPANRAAVKSAPISIHLGAGVQGRFEAYQRMIARRIRRVRLAADEAERILRFCRNAQLEAHTAADAAAKARAAAEFCVDERGRLCRRPKAGYANGRVEIYVDQRVFSVVAAAHAESGHRVGATLKGGAAAVQRRRAG